MTENNKIASTILGTKPSILIIGGGIGGLALGVFLKKIGLEASIYEAYPFVKNVGGGLNIAPNGMHVLNALGLADKLIARGMKVPVSYFADGQGKSLGHVPYGVEEVYGQPSISISRAAVYEVLADEIDAQSVQVHYEKKLVRIGEADDKVIAHFEDGSSTSADLLIGADGVHSAVRGHILPDGPKPEYVGMVAIGGFTPLTELPGLRPEEVESITYTMGTNFFGYGGSDKGTMMWWSNIWRQEEYNHQVLADLNDDEIKRELMSMYGKFHEPIPSLIQKGERLLRLNIYDIQSLPTWHRGRILLIGDAAHAVSPNSGQGASMALEDAMYLAKMMRDCKGDYAAAFQQFEAGRKPRVEAIVAEGRRRGGSKKTVSPLSAWIRNTMLKFFLRRAATKEDADPILAYKIDWDK